MDIWFFLHQIYMFQFLVLLATELSLRPGSIQLGVFMPEATEEGMGAKSKNDARSD
jgi:hypothetical protein